MSYFLKRPKKRNNKHWKRSNWIEWSTRAINGSQLARKIKYQIRWIDVINLMAKEWCCCVFHFCTHTSHVRCNTSLDASTPNWTNDIIPVPSPFATTTPINVQSVLFQVHCWLPHKHTPGSTNTYISFIHSFIHTSWTYSHLVNCAIYLNSMKQCGGSKNDVGL